MHRCDLSHSLSLFSWRSLSLTAWFAPVSRDTPTDPPPWPRAARDEGADTGCAVVRCSGPGARAAAGARGPRARPTDRPRRQPAAAARFDAEGEGLLQLSTAAQGRPQRAKPAADPAVSARVRISVSGVRGHHYQAGPELHDCMGPNLCTPNLLRSKVFPKRISAQLAIFL